MTKTMSLAEKTNLKLSTLAVEHNITDNARSVAKQSQFTK